MQSYYRKCTYTEKKTTAQSDGHIFKPDCHLTLINAIKSKFNLIAWRKEKKRRPFKCTASISLAARPFGNAVSRSRSPLCGGLYPNFAAYIMHMPMYECSIQLNHLIQQKSLTFTSVDAFFVCCRVDVSSAMSEDAAFSANNVHWEKNRERTATKKKRRRKKQGQKDTPWACHSTVGVFFAHFCLKYCKN